MTKQFSYKKIKLLLIISTALMIIGYFTVSENISITRAVKIILRISMSFYVAYLYFKINSNARIAFSIKDSLPLILYLLYLLLGLSSIIWSSNPSYSMLQWIMTSESLIFVWFLQKSIMAYNMNASKSLKLHQILAYAILSIILVFVIGKFINPNSFERLTHGGNIARLGGYYMNPNELGMLAVIGISMFLIDIKYRGLKIINCLSFLILFYALYLTGSRSSLIGFFIIVAIFVLGSKNRKLKLGSIILAFIALPLIFNTVFIKEGDLSEVLNMTGRIPFWKALLTEGLPKQPILGFGFMRIAEADKFVSVHTYAGGMTHNTFIQVLLNLGFIGLFIVLVQFFITIKTALQSKEVELKLLFITILIPCFINSLTEFGIYGETNFGILFWQLLILQYTFNVKPSTKLIDRIIRKRNLSFLNK